MLCIPANPDCANYGSLCANVHSSTGAPADVFGLGSRGSDLATLLWPIQYSLYYMGFSLLPPFMSYGVQGHGYSYASADAVREQLEANKDAWAARLDNLEQEQAIQFPGWDDWDERGQLRQAAAMG